jgi:putative glutamine amidotransferase
MSKLTIGITWSETRYDYYPQWLLDSPEEVEIIELRHENETQIEDCDGLLLTGGVDVHPQFYDSENLAYPHAETFNPARDEFEMMMFESALNLSIPILAICRGLQLVNVALGGDLIQDIEAAGKNNHRRMNDLDTQHTIAINSGSLLYAITGLYTGAVNSAHHQAVQHLSEELVANCYSPDGVIEGAEWAGKEDKAWLLAVQWHPERIIDRATNPCSVAIREAFLEACHKANG